MPLTLPELVDLERTSLQRQATALPTLPVLDGGIDPQISQGLTPMDNLGITERAIKGAWSFFKKSGIPQVVGMTVEGLERADTAFRASVLTTLGRIPLEDYPQYWNDAMDGKVKISGPEFNRLLVGKETMDMLDKVGIPGWMKQVANPEPWLAGQTPEKVPVVSIGSSIGLLSEILVSPFALLAFTPVNAFTGTKVGRAIHTVFGPAERAISWPMRKTMGLVLNSPKIPGSQFLQQLRDPQGALGSASNTDAARRAFFEMAEADAEMQRDAVHWLKEGILGGIAKKWDKIIPNRSARSSQVAKQILGIEPLPPTGSQARNFIEEVRELVIKPNWDELNDMGYTNALRRITGRTKVSKGAETVPWTRDQLLEAFNPALIHRNNLTRGIAEKTRTQRNRINLNFRNVRKDGKLPKFFDDVIDENFDIWHILSEWTMTARRKAVFERRHRTTKIIKRKRAGLTAGTTRAPSLFPRGSPSSAQIVEDVTIHPWVNTGWVRKWAPRTGWKEGGKRIPGGNRELIGMNINEFHYLQWKVNDFTGNARGRHMILAGLIAEKFWAGVEESIESAARKGRIRSYFFNKTKQLINPRIGYNFPKFMTPQNLSHVFISRMMIATLGGNLGTAIKQTSQLINTAAVHGIPVTMKGLYYQADRISDTGRMLVELRREAGLGNTLKKIAHDFEWERTLDGTFEKVMFAPFNFMENLARGTSGNIAVGQFLKKQGINSYDDLRRAIDVAGPNAKPIFWNNLMREMRTQSNDTNLLYGLAGRSSLLSGPVARMGVALKSYSWKEAEFIARTYQRDGSSVVRLLALHGWAIGMLDRIAGVNAEAWLGWGFLPPDVLGRAPQVQVLTDFVQYLVAAGSGNDKAADKHITAMASNMREVWRLFGNPDVPGEIGAAVHASSLFGLTKIPIIAIARGSKAANEFRTGIRESNDGTTWKPVDKAEQMKSWFFQSHEDHADAQLRAMSARFRRQVDVIADRRADAFLRALSKADGEAVNQAAREYLKPIQLGFGTNIPRALFFRDQDEVSYWMPMSGILSRLKLRMRKKIIAKPVREMIDGDFATDILWAKYYDQAAPFLQHGFIRGLTDRERAQ